MSVNFRDLLPAAQAPIEAIGQIEWVRDLNQTAWLFAIIETSHLLFLVILGGAVFVLNLRLLGAILPGVPVQEVERASRPWLRTGIIGTVVTGTYMAIATAVTLLPNRAFFVKMVALVAAIALSSALSRQVREGHDGASYRPTPLAIAAIAVWLAALALFAGTTGLSSGSLLVALAGLGLFAAILVTYRGLYFAALLVAAVLGLVVALGSSDSRAGLAVLGLAFLVALVAGVIESRRSATPLLSAERIGALSSTLAWVTVAAAGRWIGFS